MLKGQAVWPVWLEQRMGKGKTQGARRTGWLETAEYGYPLWICNSKDRSLLVFKTQSSYSRENRLWRTGREVGKRKQEFGNRTN